MEIFDRSSADLAGGKLVKGLDALSLAKIDFDSLRAPSYADYVDEFSPMALAVREMLPEEYTRRPSFSGKIPWTEPYQDYLPKYLPQSDRHEENPNINLPTLSGNFPWIN